MLNALADLATRRARRIVVLAVLGAVVAGAVGAGVANRLDPYGDDDPATESVQADERLQAAGYQELGLIALVVNGLLFLLTSWIADQLDLPFHVDGFWPEAVLGALFVGIVASVLAITWRAARLLAARGRSSLATLAHALVIAQAAMLTALFFITDGSDLRLWVLFGLGLVLHLLAVQPVRSAGDR